MCSFKMDSGLLICNYNQPEPNQNNHLHFSKPYAEPSNTGAKPNKSKLVGSQFRSILLNQLAPLDLGA